MNIAEKLIKLRKERGLTQENLSQQLEISISAIRNYENIKKPREPKNDMLLKFANFYNVSTEYLLNDEITNKTTDNITIENKLNFSDNTIEKIIKINKYINNEIIGQFIDNMPIREFWEVIGRYIEINEEIKDLSNLKGITECSAILDKYSTNNTFNMYKYFDKDGNVERYDINAFCKNNKCKYTKKDKEILLIWLDKLQNSQTLTKRNFKYYELLFDDYGIHINNLKRLINENSRIPIHISKIITSIPQIEIDERTNKKEVIKFQLSNELTNFLTYLDKKGQEAE